MHLDLHARHRDTHHGHEARSIVGKCVHCGFCTAACPTYRLTGNELESPRGRIYLIKQALESDTVGPTAQAHLDSCLTCRACEPACPSGVEFGRLMEIGQELVAEQRQRSTSRQFIDRVTFVVLTRPVLFAMFLRLGRLLRPLLPACLTLHIPPSGASRSAAAPKIPIAPPRGAASRAQRAILLEGCVQPVLLPNVNAATRRVLARLGIETITADGAGCCGALRLHGGDALGGLDDARRNIDRWWPLIESGADAIVMTASGCGITVRDYGRLLRDDTTYAVRAARISAMTVDLCEIVGANIDRLNVPTKPSPRIVFHTPCTLQHGQRLGGRVDALLIGVGAQVLPVANANQCCGSAGTYSLRHPDTASELRERKLQSLMQDSPEVILSANVGCINHLSCAATRPVLHWVEWLDQWIDEAGVQRPG